jgi:F0F1-type ATP synthase membrane subunit c/vacuolar-type H+-ATPase subunit K
VTTSAGERTTTLDARVGETHRRASFIVTAIITSILLYVVIALYIVSRPLSQGFSDQTRISFYAAATFLALGSIFYRRAQMRRMRLEVVTGLRGINGLLKHFFQVTIVCVAMADLIGLLALVVSFVGGDRSDVVRFGVVAIAVALFTYPRRRSWQQAADYFTDQMPGIDE